MPGPGNCAISSLVRREEFTLTLLTFTPRLSSLPCAFRNVVRKAEFQDKSPDLGVVERQEEDRTDPVEAGRGESLKDFPSV